MARATPEALEAQARWEVHWVQTAIKRYRETVAHKPLADLPAGQALLKACVPPLEAAIKVRQDDAQGASRGTGYTPGGPEWHGPVLALEPDRLAVLTISSALRVESDRPPDGGNVGSVRGLSLSLAASLGAQLDYDAWAKDADETILESVLRRYPAMSRQTWSRVKKKLDLEPSVRWPVSQCLQIGATLVGCLLEACPDYFSMVTRTSQGRTENVLVLSERAQEIMQDRASRAEVASPMFLPMICQPNDWRYETAV